MGGTTRVRGKGHTIAVTVARPADTTPYTAGDTVGSGLFTFNNASFGEFDSGIIQSASIMSSAYVATPLDGELWLFDTAPTAPTDNAACALTDAELKRMVPGGIITFSYLDWKIGIATAGVDGNQVCVARNLGIPFNTLKGKHSLFGVLRARNAYVPISAEEFTITLGIFD